ncbi:hypothetical protein ACFT2C_17450 [Promicromonospora sp. NPDC057138]|uniref:hypothetical protein n=1 Tax=Promicromonospora sp. NPDC057138 TaxID=3346031 RepID=UPI0036272B90
MVNIDEKIAGLRAAAENGDPEAARELGRLLSLTLTDPQEPGEGEPEWPEERWLRAAVQARPDDVEALMLLAGRLAAQSSSWENYWEMNPDEMAAEGKDESTISRMWAEVSDLHTRILAAGPPPHAVPGLERLGELVDVHAESVAEAAYSFYALQDDAQSGSVLNILIVVATDLDELRWACDQWLALTDGGIGQLTVRTYVDGDETSQVDLDEHLDGARVAWDAVPVPELTGTLLPAGLPVPGPSHSGLWHYGVTVEVG